MALPVSPGSLCGCHGAHLANMWVLRHMSARHVGATAHVDSSRHVGTTAHVGSSCGCYGAHLANMWVLRHMSARHVGTAAHVGSSCGCHGPHLPNMWVLRRTSEPKEVSARQSHLPVPCHPLKHHLFGRHPGTRSVYVLIDTEEPVCIVVRSHRV